MTPKPSSSKQGEVMLLRIIRIAEILVQVDDTVQADTTTGNPGQKTQITHSEIS